MDGTGYPHGLKGKEIPISARLFAIIDVWDAISSDRPYRKSMSQEEVYLHILSQSGCQFDPIVVQLSIEVSKTFDMGQDKREAAQ